MQLLAFQDLTSCLVMATELTNMMHVHAQLFGTYFSYISDIPISVIRYLIRVDDVDYGATKKFIFYFKKGP